MESMVESTEMAATNEVGSSKAGATAKASDPRSSEASDMRSSEAAAAKAHVAATAAMATATAVAATASPGRGLGCDRYAAQRQSGGEGED